MIETDRQYIDNALKTALDDVDLKEFRGRVVRVVGPIIEAVGAKARIGEICNLKEKNDSCEIAAEVIGFSDGRILLSPLGRTHGLSTSTEVIFTGKQQQVPVGQKIMGRVIDGLGRPLDEDSGALSDLECMYPIYAEPPNPLKRKVIHKAISTGVRAIDALMTCCEGQRIGIFAGAGVGKSTLLAMIARRAEVDVIVLTLIGERGREVREYIEGVLGPEGLAKSVVVVATSDRPAMERIKAAYSATAIAEYFRDQGKRVLLMMDSVTRFARAQREMGLAAGEPPTRQGYPPSLFATLPTLMERPGLTEEGSITALYTVLVEGDDMNEPVADETRSILDGHIILSKKLAAANHYPAIDVLKSISRVMNDIVEKEHTEAASKARNLLAKYDEIEILVRVGEYKKGTDPTADEALEKNEAINNFLKQRIDEKSVLSTAVAELIETVDR